MTMRERLSYPRKNYDRRRYASRKTMWAVVFFGVVVGLCELCMMWLILR